MTFLVIGDPHFKDNALQAGRILVQRVLEIVKEHQPRAVVILGDVLDKHNVADMAPFCLVYEFLRDLSALAQTFVLIGNHDRASNDDFLSSQSFFAPYHEWNKDRIRIIDQPYVEIIDGHKYGFCPYVPPGRLLEALDRVEWRDSVAVFGHNDIRGCTIATRKGKPIISENGDVWPEGIYYWGGHNHEAHVVNPWVFFTGTPRQVSYAESEDKGVYLVDFVPKYEYRKINLGFPPKRTLVLTPENFASTVIPNDGVLYRVKITGPSSEISTALSHPVVKEWISRGIKVEQCPTTLPASYVRVDTSSFQYQGYRSYLRSAVENSPELLEIYTRLYPDRV